MITDARLLKRQIPKLTFVEFLSDIFGVKITKLSRNVRSLGLKNILQKIIDDNEIYGIIVVDDFDSVVQYFYESLESVLELPDDLLKYFDVVQFIIDLIKSKEFSIYDVELGDEEVYVIIIESDFTFDETDIMKSLDELEGTNE
jgi:hypothetical protein